MDYVDVSTAVTLAKLENNVFLLHSPNEWTFELIGVDVINKRLLELVVAVAVAGKWAERMERLALTTDSNDDEDGNDDVAATTADEADAGAGVDAVIDAADDVIVYGVV